MELYNNHHTQPLPQVLASQAATDAPQSNALQEQQPLSPALRQRTEALLSRHSDRKTFLEYYNPGKQREVIATSPDRIFHKDTPTLAIINTTYGENTATAWLVAQLVDLSEYCGIRDKFTDWQLEECAAQIVGTYYYLNVAELMQFFARFKAGKYGHFYGAVDPLVVTTALHDSYLPERRDAIEKIEAERAVRQREEWANIRRISWQLSPQPAPAPKVEKPVATKPVAPKHDNTSDIAYGIINNIYKADASTLSTMRDVFRKKHGTSPEEYVQNSLTNPSQQ